MTFLSLSSDRSGWHDFVLNLIEEIRKSLGKTIPLSSSGPFQCLVAIPGSTVRSVSYGLLPMWV